MIAQALLVSMSCNEKQPCSDPTNPDCYNYRPVVVKKDLRADFSMVEDFGMYPRVQGWEYYDTDTSLSPFVTFTALDSTAIKYLWQIGSDTFSSRSITVQFPFPWLYHTGNVRSI